MTVRMINTALTHYEKKEDNEFITVMYELRDLLSGVEE